MHHDRQYAHGDVKLANLLISEDGIVKIADLNNIANISSQDIVNLHACLARVYTATHVAPEILLGETTALMMTKVDIFAFGITMLEVIQAPAKLHRRTAGSLALPRIDVARFDGIEPIQELIKRCLSDKPKDRPDMQEVVREIKQLCLDDTISVLPSSLLSQESYPASLKTNTVELTQPKNAGP
eukprot:TRINITY_DN4943_c0_g1_i3.p2 TRINITY_DN4943_c0_g1~~TRINITY_DN4943_c0_g1_i3.p2  ORF type:complete len:184 (+),score=25.58 TRINITY_DN4943_c0_g1_i3:1038-1589(+)